MRIPIFLGFILASALQAGGRPACPPLAALITTEQTQVGSDGITKVLRFRERLVRTPDRVWLERVLPEVHAHSEPEAEHRHLDLDVAARDVTREVDGSLRLSFVHRGERTVVATEPRDHPEVGFHDSWAVVCHLVDPAVLATLKPLSRRAPAGARWFGKRSAEGTFEVLWSEARQVALAVVSARTDGTRAHRITVTPSPMPATLPWEEVGGYRRKDYTDLLD